MRLILRGFNMFMTSVDEFSLLASLKSPIVNSEMLSTPKFYVGDVQFGSPALRNCRMSTHIAGKLTREEGRGEKLEETNRQNFHIVGWLLVYVGYL